MISRREWLGLSLGAGAALALNPRLLWAAGQQLITRAIPSTGERLPIVGLGSSATFGQVARSEDAAALRDVLRATAETEESLLRAGFPPAVVASVHRLTRFDAGFPYLEHLGVVAASKDLAAKRVAMAALLREERHAARVPHPEHAGTRERRRKAMEILRRGLGY